MKRIYNEKWIFKFHNDTLFLIGCGEDNTAISVQNAKDTSVVVSINSFYVEVGKRLRNIKTHNTRVFRGGHSYSYSLDIKVPKRN